jgi:hypothetical protein
MGMSRGIMVDHVPFVAHLSKNVDGHQFVDQFGLSFVVPHKATGNDVLFARHNGRRRLDTQPNGMRFHPGPLKAFLDEGRRFLSNFFRILQLPSMGWWEEWMQTQDRSRNQTRSLSSAYFCLKAS